MQLAGASPPGYRVECEPERDPVADVIVFPRPGPWSARAPGVTCTLTAAPEPSQGDVDATLFQPRALAFEAVTGRAVEELTVVARAEREGGQRWSLRTRAIVHHGDVVRYALPNGLVDRVEIALVPSRLPFVKLGSLAVVVDEARPPSAARVSSVLLRLAAVGGIWALATAALAPSPLRAAAAAAAVLFLPGFLFERALGGGRSRNGLDLGAPARWLTLSVAIAALAGLATTLSGGRHRRRAGGHRHGLGGLGDCRKREPARRSAAHRPRRFSTSVSRASLFAASPRPPHCSLPWDRTLHAIACGISRSSRISHRAARSIGSSHFSGPGIVAPRFAHNGWLVVLAAWARLAELGPALVFERLAPPLLSLVTASAAWQLATRLLPGAPGLAALSTAAVLAATRYPFFSPDAYAFFSRIAEDKIIALLIFVPVALAAIADVLDRSQQSTGTRWLAVALALVAVGFTHPLVLMLLGIALVALLPLSAARCLARSVSRRGRCSLLAAALAAAAGEDRPRGTRSHRRDGRPRRGMERGADAPGRARAPANAAASGAARRRPHRRAAPRRRAAALLGLLGVPFAWAKRRSTGGALLVATSLPFLALAFMPGVAPVFGRIVLPWMAYRALWMVPFGCLLALALSGVVARRYSARQSRCAASAWSRSRPSRSARCRGSAFEAAARATTS